MREIMVDTNPIKYCFSTSGNTKENLAVGNELKKLIGLNRYVRLYITDIQQIEAMDIFKQAENLKRKSFSKLNEVQRTLIVFANIVRVIGITIDEKMLGRMKRYNEKHSGKLMKIADMAIAMTARDYGLQILSNDGHVRNFSE